MQHLAVSSIFPAKKKKRKKDHVHIKEFRITTSKKAKAVIISNMMTTQYPHIVDGAMRNY